MEGHYTVGVGDGKNAPETPLDLLPNALDSARSFLVDRPQTLQRLDRVAKLIDGFETPFGMELLATGHWVMKHEAVTQLEDVVVRVHAWSDRKKSAMKPGHIGAAWMRLREHGWAAAPA